jgi:stage II sporulation protein D
MPRAGWSLTATLVLGACMPPDEVATIAEPVAAAPTLRVGLFTSTTRPIVAGSHGLSIRDPLGAELDTLSTGSTLQLTVHGNDVVFTLHGSEVVRPAVVLVPLDTAGTVLINGRAYRGRVELSRGSDGVRVINHVDLETYLVAVVGAEMGRRAIGEEASLEAQAVASRTYTLRNLGRFDAQGFDLAADVSSQVYGGVASELPMARLAVERTRGEILTVDGEPIEAFYSSTCGGHSESSGAIFSGDRSYLPARPDLAPDGTAWCAISPAYRWRQQWNGAQIAATLRRTLAAERLSVARATDLREARVLDRTTSGRVQRLELVGVNGRTIVTGGAIRRVFEPPTGGLLRSNDFTLRITRNGGRIERVEAEGRGYGHGVGMCQWGAIARARAGQGYGEILLSYYPGAELRKAY